MRQVFFLEKRVSCPRKAVAHHRQQEKQPPILGIEHVAQNGEQQSGACEVERPGCRMQVLGEVVGIKLFQGFEIRLLHGFVWVWVGGGS